MYPQTKKKLTTTQVQIQFFFLVQINDTSAVNYQAQILSIAIYKPLTSLNHDIFNNRYLLQLLFLRVGFIFFPLIHSSTQARYFLIFMSLHYF